MAEPVPSIVDQSARAVACSLGSRFAFGTVRGWVVISTATVLAPVLAGVEGPWRVAFFCVLGGLAAIGFIFLVNLIVAPVHQRNEARRLLNDYRSDNAVRAIERLREFVIDRGGADLDALRCLTARDINFGVGMSTEAFRFLLYQKGVDGNDDLAAAVLGFMATVGVVRSETRDGLLVFVLTEFGVRVLERLDLPRRGVQLPPAPVAEG